MGNKSVKAVSISYEEAEQRVTESELKRLSGAFRRCCPSGAMPLNVFAREVLGGGYPPPVAKQLFYALAGRSSRSKTAIQFKELVPGLVLLTRGKDDEIYKFLFGLYANENLEVTKDVMDKMVLETEGNISEPLSELFERTNQVDYPTFKEWVRRYPGFTALSHTLLENRCTYTLRSEDNKLISFHQSLAGVTHLVESEIVELERKFSRLKENSPAGELDLSTFTRLVSPPVPDSHVGSLFEAFDANGDGHIDLKELVCGISVSCRGPEVERHKFCFRVFDSDHDGYLALPELVAAIKASMHFIKVGCVESNSNDLLNLEPYTIAKEVLQCHDGDKDDRLTLEDYLGWAMQTDLPKQFMRVLYEVCHVVLGLRPDTKEAEGRVINGWLDREVKAGLSANQTWFLVAMGWWRKWQEYVSDGAVKAIELDSVIPGEVHKRGQYSFSPAKHQQLAALHAQQQKPGLINNTPLVAPPPYEVPTLTNEGGKLKSNPKVVEGQDFVAVPEKVWKALQSWYNSNISLPRNAIVPADGSKPVLELYPYIIRLYKHKTVAASFTSSITSVAGVTSLASMAFNPSSIQQPKRTFSNIAFFSQRHTLCQVIDFLCSSQRATRDSMRLWLYRNESDIQLLDEEEKTMEELAINDRQKILIELRNKDLTWPEELLKIIKNKPGQGSSAEEGERSKDESAEKGVAGLSNLGNTCFLNSALQCVSNTKPLTSYFCEDFYLYELNKTNPIGLKGRLALSYADLVKDLWSGTRRSVVPYKLKWTLARFAPQFSGTQQQDAQEVLAFLLDGLHEDLNRVTDKPYCELRDSDGRPDRMVAQEAWDNHLLRNRSVVVDLFHGQLKSKVCCKECGHESVRFDPFTYLTLPLPMESCLHMEVIYIPVDGSTPIKYGMRLTSEDTYEEVVQNVVELSSAPSKDHVLLAEVFGPTVRVFPERSSRVKQCVSGLIYAYQVTVPLPKAAPNAEPESVDADTHASAPVPTYDSGRPAPTSENPLPNGGCVYFDNVTGATSLGMGTGAGDAAGMINSLPSAFTASASSPPVADSGGPAKTLSENRGSETSLQSYASRSDHLGNGASGGPWRSGGDNSGGPGTLPPSNVIVVFHRKMEMQEHYFLASQKALPFLFGTPLVVSNAPGMTQRQLYVAIWRLVARLLTSHSAQQSSNHAQDCDDSLKSEYPFSLSVTARSGLYCATCPYYRACRGCPIPCTDSPLSLPEAAFVAIDWEMTAVHLRYQTSRERDVTEDASVSESYREQSSPITLDDCLSAFTKEEELREAELYYCSQCKKHQLASKSLQIWRLPPILIIHMKRFQPYNGRWVKSHKVVEFPYDDFNPSKFFASAADQPEPSANGVEQSEQSQTTLEPTDASTPHSTRNGAAGSGAHVGMPNGALTNGLGAGVGTGGDNHLPNGGPPQLCAEDGQPAGALKYNLFSMSCHRGVLGGGHYVSYSRHSNNKWYEYNDSTVKEVPRDGIDDKSSYILFYERTDYDYERILPDVKGRSVDSVEQYKEEINAEFNKSVDKMCCIQ